MPETRNLCAQLPLDLHAKVCEAREASGLTTAQYITQLLTEYFEIKENGGNAAMTSEKNRTLAFQISENLYQRIKTHLERETARTGRKLTQRDFVLGLIKQALDEAESSGGDGEASVAPCPASEEPDDAQDDPAALSA